jgi:hypothetical protein
MSKVIELSKRFNDSWKTDPLFIEGFDYDHPKYENVADDLKWMLPMREAQKSPAVKRGHAEVAAEAKAKFEDDRRQARLELLKKMQDVTGPKPTSKPITIPR